MVLSKATGELDEGSFNGPNLKNIGPGKEKRRIRKLNPDSIPKLVLTALALSAVIVIFFIIIYIAVESIPALKEVGIWNFLTGEIWNLDPHDSDAGLFGAKPSILGTALVTAGSVLIAVPLGVGAAIYISEIATEKVRNIIKPVIEIFAGIPSVVYGFFGWIVLSPILVKLLPDFFQYPSSWFLSSLILGIMALPTIASVTEDALRAVPRSYRHASLAMGATDWETIRKVVLPAASSGIITASILGIGRAMGETMAVLMVTGGSASTIPEPLYNIFSNITTLTATIAKYITEVDQGGIQYSALFVLALILMASVLAVNLIAKAVGKHTKRKMGIGKKSKRFPKISERVEKFSKNRVFLAMRMRRSEIFTMFWVVMIFTFTTLMSTLMVSDLFSVIIGLSFTLVYLALVVFVNSLNPKDRQTLAFGGLKLVIVLILVVLGVIIGDIVIKGLPAISFEFIFGYPSDGGESGGIWPAIVGTLELVGLSSLIAFPVGIGAGIYLSLYAREGRFTGIVRQAVDALNGTPSIVFGLFGMAVFVSALGWGRSLIAGSFTLALMVLPVIIKTTEEAVSSVPVTFMQASMAMGSSKWQAIYKVVLPAAAGGVITGLILSLGRTAGETAPVMVTAAVAYSSVTSVSLFEPVMTLSYQLYYLAMNVPQAIENTYGIALVLLVLVLSMFLLASLVRNYYSKHNKW